jgi:hypothetical protein
MYTAGKVAPGHGAILVASIVTPSVYSPWRTPTPPGGPWIRRSRLGANRNGS